jgi:hypothetical protein
MDVLIWPLGGDHYSRVIHNDPWGSPMFSRCVSKRAVRICLKIRFEDTMFRAIRIELFKAVASSQSQIYNTYNIEDGCHLLQRLCERTFGSGKQLELECERNEGKETKEGCFGCVYQNRKPVVHVDKPCNEINTFVHKAMVQELMLLTWNARMILILVLSRLDTRTPVGKVMLKYRYG